MVMEDATPLTPPSAHTELYFQTKQIQSMILEDQKNIINNDVVWVDSLQYPHKH